MSIISCPNCSRGVKKNQEKCWHCGCPIEKNKSADIINLKNQKNNSKDDSQKNKDLTSISDVQNFSSKKNTSINDNESSSETDKNNISQLNPETKFCPFCAEEIKFDAILCRFCNSKINSRHSNKTVNKSNSKNQKNSSLTKNIGCFGFIYTMIAILGLFLFLATGHVFAFLILITGGTLLWARLKIWNEVNVSNNSSKSD